MYKKILLANSGSIEADGAFEPSLTLASRFGAELHMLLIEELPRFPLTIAEVVGEKRATDQRCAYIVASAQRCAKEARVNFRAHVVVGRFIGKIVEFVAENEIDLLVVGPSKRLPGGHFLFGDSSYRLLRSVPCAVHFVK